MAQISGRIHKLGLFCTLAVAVLSTSACTMWKLESAPLPELMADDKPGTLRITRKDNSTVVLTSPAILNDSIVGSTEAEPPQRVAIALSDVIFVQQRKRSFDKTMDGVMTTTQVVMGVILLTTTIIILSIVP